MFEAAFDRYRIKPLPYPRDLANDLHAMLPTYFCFDALLEYYVSRRVPTATVTYWRSRSRFSMGGISTGAEQSRTRPTSWATANCRCARYRVILRFGGKHILRICGLDTGKRLNRVLTGLASGVVVIAGALAVMSCLASVWRMPMRCSLRSISAQPMGSAAFASSRILPLKTHPACGYACDELPEGDEIVRRFKKCGRFAKRHHVRTSFHPDQFVVLKSPRPDVVEKSVEELKYQAEVAQWVGADVLNVHAGGAYGDKQRALENLSRNVKRLPRRVRARLTVEVEATAKEVAVLRLIEQLRTRLGKCPGESPCGVPVCRGR